MSIPSNYLPPVSSGISDYVELSPTNDSGPDSNLLNVMEFVKNTFARYKSEKGVFFTPSLQSCVSDNVRDEINEGSISFTITPMGEIEVGLDTNSERFLDPANLTYYPKRMVADQSGSKVLDPNGYLYELYDRIISARLPFILVRYFKKKKRSNYLDYQVGLLKNTAKLEVFNVSVAKALRVVESYQNKMAAQVFLDLYHYQKGRLERYFQNYEKRFVKAYTEEEKNGALFLHVIQNALLNNALIMVTVLRGLKDHLLADQRDIQPSLMHYPVIKALVIAYKKNHMENFKKLDDPKQDDITNVQPFIDFFKKTFKIALVNQAYQELAALNEVDLIENYKASFREMVWHALLRINEFDDNAKEKKANVYKVLNDLDVQYYLDEEVTNLVNKDKAYYQALLDKAIMQVFLDLMGDRTYQALDTKLSEMAKKVLKDANVIQYLFSTDPGEDLPTVMNTSDTKHIDHTNVWDCYQNIDVTALFTAPVINAIRYKFFINVDESLQKAHYAPIREKRIPSSYEMTLPTKGIGVIYFDPTFPDNSVRIMLSVLNSPHPEHQIPHVIQKFGQRAVDKYGYLTNPKNRKAHIPYPKYFFRRKPRGICPERTNVEEDIEMSPPIDRNRRDNPPSCYNPEHSLEHSFEAKAKRTAGKISLLNMAMQQLGKTGSDPASCDPNALGEGKTDTASIEKAMKQLKIRGCDPNASEAGQN